MSGAKRGNWSAQELIRLRELWPRLRADEVARRLRRSAESVQRRAQRLFAGGTVRGAWTPDEERTLREAYGAVEIERIAAILHRPPREVRARVRRLRAELRRGAWSPSEVMDLKRLYGTRADADLVVCLSRPRAQIRAKARELQLAKDKRYLARLRADSLSRTPMPRWNAAELDTLRLLYRDHDNLEIARRLRRSVASVANKAHRLGLQKSPALLEVMGRRNISSRWS